MTNGTAHTHDVEVALHQEVVRVRVLLANVNQVHDLGVDVVHLLVGEAEVMDEEHVGNEVAIRKSAQNRPSSNQGLKSQIAATKPFRDQD